MKNNILVVYSGLDVSGLIGVIKPLSYLSQNAHISLTHKATSKVTDTDLKNSDIIILIREFSSIALNLCVKAKNFKKYIIYYSDDLLLDVPTYSLSYKYLSNPTIKKTLINILKLCNCLWSTNKNLSQEYKPYVSTSFVTNATAILLETPSVISPTFMQSKKETVIGFAGGLDNTFFINNFFKDVLISLFDKYKDKIRFEIFGSDQSFMKNYPKGTITYIPYESDLNKYATTMKNLNWDIGVAPLGKSKFNSCKYYNKFMEYGSAKIPGVYSNVEPFTFVIKDKINGLLIDNDKSKWIDGISNLIENPASQRFICKNAFDHLQKYNTSEYVGKEFINALKLLNLF